jgi:hypothetical protein
MAQPEFVRTRLSTVWERLSMRSSTSGEGAAGDGSPCRCWPCGRVQVDPDDGGAEQERMKFRKRG